MSIALSRVSGSPWMLTWTYGLISTIESRADSAFGRPISDWPWMIWRCRFDSSTVSNSTMPSVPTPAAARYMQGRRAESAGADAQHLRVLEALLTRDTDIGDDQVARIPSNLIDGQILGRFDQWWQGHDLQPPRARVRVN